MASRYQELQEDSGERSKACEYCYSWHSLPCQNECDSFNEDRPVVDPSREESPASQPSSCCRPLPIISSSRACSWPPESIRYGIRSARNRWVGRSQGSARKEGPKTHAFGVL